MSDIQYLTIETCKSRNEIQIFEIMEYYTAVFTGEKAVFISEEMHQETKDWANGIRNEAREILGSRLTGDSLLLLQAKFLSKFNQFYMIGEEKIPAKFDEFLKGCYLTIEGTKMLVHHKLFNKYLAKLPTNSNAQRIIDCYISIHNDIIAGEYGNGKFVQC